MILNGLSQGNSIIHELDPRIKISIALFFSITAALSTTIPILIALLSAASLLALLSRPGLKPLALRLAMVNFFIVFVWLIVPFSYPGETVFRFGPWSASHEGLLSAFSITLKCNAIILCNIALLSSNTIFQLSHAIRHLGAPDKLVHLFFLIHRYGFVLLDEYNRMHDALRTRGFRPKANLFTYRTYAYLIANLLIKGYERSEQVHRAMICRGFTGKYWVFEHFSLKPIDIIFGLLLSAFIITLIIIQWIIIL